MPTLSYKAATGVIGLGLFLALAPETEAADHFDGDVTAHATHSDIADFYAFPVTEDGPTRLALIMNTHPRAGTEALFSDAVSYGFRIRPASLERTATGVANRVGEREFRVACGFDVVDESSLTQQVTCSLFDAAAKIATTAVTVDDTSGGGHPAFRVFAGLRADPFFTDAIRVRLPRPRHSSLPSFISTGNSMRPAKLAVGVKLGGPEETRKQIPNVLSLVVEIEVDELLDGTGPRFAVVAETTRRPLDQGATP